MSEKAHIEFFVNSRSIGKVSVERALQLTLRKLSELVVIKEDQFRGYTLVYAVRNKENKKILAESDSELRSTIQAHVNDKSSAIHFHVTAMIPASPAPVKKEMKFLKELSVEEVVTLFENLPDSHNPNLSPACFTLIRDRKISGRVLSAVESADDLRDCGLTQEVLPNIRARILFQTVEELNADGVDVNLLQSTAQPDLVIPDQPAQKEEKPNRELSSLDHEECILLLEHLHVENVRTSLRADVTGVELSAIKSIADFEGLGINHGGYGLVLKEEILKCLRNGIKPSLFDEQRVAYMQERAKQRAVSPLLVAFEDKNKEMFLRFAKEIENANEALNSNGLTALHFAVELAADDRVWFEKCLALLIARNANLNVTAVDGWTALHAAASQGQHGLVEALLKQGANAEIKSTAGDSAFNLAAQKGHLDVLNVFLSRGARSSPNENGVTALHLAAKHGHIRIVERLLEAGVNALELDSRGYSAISYASFEGHSAIVSFLLDKAYEKVPFVSLSDDSCASLLSHLGCSMTVSNSRRMSLAQLLSAIINEEDEREREFALKGLGAWKDNVCMNDIAENLKRMLQHGVSKGLTSERREYLIQIIRPWFDKAKEEGVSPLYCASHAGNIQGVEALLECTFDMVENESEQIKEYMRENVLFRVNKSEIQKHQSTPLHAAAVEGHTEIASLLLTRKANTEATDEFQLTPLHYAALSGHAETAVSPNLTQKAGVESDEGSKEPTSLFVPNTATMSLLISKNAKIEARDKLRKTPLHHAAEKGHKEAVSFLLAQNASIEATTLDRKTPLHLACRGGHLELVSSLIARSANIDAIDKNMKTPLDIAVHYRKSDVAALLIERRANVGATDRVDVGSAGRANGDVRDNNNGSSSSNTAEERRAEPTSMMTMEIEVKDESATKKPRLA